MINHHDASYKSSLLVFSSRLNSQTNKSDQLSGPFGTWIPETKCSRNLLRNVDVPDLGCSEFSEIPSPKMLTAPETLVHKWKPRAWEMLRCPVASGCSACNGSDGFIRTHSHCFQWYKSPNNYQKSIIINSSLTIHTQNIQ